MAYLSGFGAEGDHLRGRFETQWKSKRSYTDAQMAARVAWPNVNFTPPDGVPWVRFGVLNEPGARRVNPGPNPMRRYDGTIMAEVFVPRNTGPGTLDDYCDDIADIFRDYTSQQGLRIGTPFTVDVGPQDGWYKKDVMIPFVRDTVHS